MFKVIATDVVISKGYDGAPALKFSENGESVRFRIGKKVYDTRAENNTRWVNLSVKAFGPVCDRIKRCSLKRARSSIFSAAWTRMSGRTARRMKKEAPWWSFWMKLSIAPPAAESRRPRKLGNSPERLPHPQSLSPTERCPVISPALNPSAA